MRLTAIRRELESECYRMYGTHPYEIGTQAEVEVELTQGDVELIRRVTGIRIVTEGYDQALADFDRIIERIDLVRNRIVSGVSNPRAIRDEIDALSDAAELIFIATSPEDIQGELLANFEGR